MDVGLDTLSHSRASLARKTGHDLMPSWGRGYESGCLKVRKEIPVKLEIPAESSVQTGAVESRGESGYQKRKNKAYLLKGLLLLAVAMLSACGGDSGGGNNSSSSSPPPSLGSPSPITSIGIDYTPESRCSDNNWSTTTPVACNPQLAFTRPTGDPLSQCPSSCQACYVSDLTNLQSMLGTSTITAYQPNYYILTAADQLTIKVIQGLH
jgi:hypothetical protein